MKKILITGSAGFIGYHLTKRLLSKGNFVVGIDNINDYYDIELKYARLAETGVYKKCIQEFKEIKSDSYNYSFYKVNINDKEQLEDIFKTHNFDIVVNLAAQAGVRYSIDNPDVYVQSNILGFFNILECCRNHKIEHLLYASSSSVYGKNKKIPFCTGDMVDKPISLYAATKKSNELMAYTYSHLYGIPVTGMRFFTVYGPWGRPDMAIFLFTKSIIEDKPINIFNNGDMKRDFTYIDDIIKGIEILIDNPPNTNKSDAAYSITNIGNGKPSSLLKFIEAIEKSLQIKSKKNFLPMQAGDVPQTWANNEFLNKLGYKTQFSIEKGVRNFVNWYKTYYKI